MNEFHGIGIRDIGDMKKNIWFHFENENTKQFSRGGNGSVWARLFFVETLANLNIQLTIMFHLVMTLYEGGGTLGVVAMLDKDPILTIVPHSTSKGNKMNMLKTPSILACSYY